MQLSVRFIYFELTLYKFEKLVHLVGLLQKYITMHGSMNAKFISAKQAKETYRYRDIKGKLHKTNAAVWYSKMCREKQE
jgi:hypothetical protein